MTELILSNLEDDIRAKLEALAAEHGRSVEDEAQELLRTAVLQHANGGPTGNLGTKLVERFRGFDLQEGEIEELRGHPAKPAEFD